MKFCIISNVNIDSLANKLGKLYDVHMLDGYGTWISECLNSQSSLYNSSITDFFITLDNHEPIDFSATLNAIKALSTNLTYCNFYISNFMNSMNRPLPLNQEAQSYDIDSFWNEELSHAIKQNTNIYSFDLKSIVLRYGQEKIYSEKMWYLAHIPFSSFGEKCILDKITQIISARYLPRKKCLLLDLDNTLWGGVIGEDGVDGIELDCNNVGKRYHDFQKQILAIKETGVLLGIVSKNNLEDAQNGFKHPHAILSWSDFVIHKVNWEKKSKNIIEIANTLNIGLDSIVFLDDNPVERAEVNAILPEVTVPNFPTDTCSLASFANSIYRDYFYILNLSDEDKNKSTMYKASTKREDLRKQSTSLSDYLIGLQMQLHLSCATLQDINRLHQMFLKTNQFNLTAKKYNEKDIATMLKDPLCDIIKGTLCDKFGDNGLCILAVIKKEGHTATIDSFLMSCRVMNRTVEHATIQWIENNLRNEGMKTLNTSMLVTSKNTPVHDLYSNFGYELINTDDNGNKFYKYDLTQPRVLENFVKPFD